MKENFQKPHFSASEIRENQWLRMGLPCAGLLLERPGNQTEANAARNTRHDRKLTNRWLIATMKASAQPRRS